MAFAYDAGGRLVEKNFPNGATTRYTYNPDNTLARVVNRVGSSDASVISQHTYTYDGVGNRVTHTERVGATTTPYAYTYDPLSRLIQVSNSATGAVLESDTYDPLGNRLTKTSGGAITYYRYDAASQLTQTCADAGCTSTTGTFTYDLSGNLVSRTDGAFTTMAYDAENRLAWISVAGQVEQSYAYDHRGRRIRKTVGGTTTQYLYDGPNIVAEYTTWASPTARTTHGPGTDAPVLRTAATTQYFHQDGLGSVVALSNGNGGTDATSRYDAWGVRISGTGAIPLYGYTGREPDETGLIYYRARYYDPTLGRFTQRDPIGFDGGDINLYTYVWNSPTNHVDPTGEAPWVAGAIYGAISGGVGGFITSTASGASWRGIAGGTLVGAGAGAVVGVAAPWLSRQVGAVAAGFVVSSAASAVGQVAGSIVNQQNAAQNFSVAATIGAGIGGGLGARVGSVLGATMRESFGTALPQMSGYMLSTTGAKTIEVVRTTVEGVSIGFFETVGNAVGNAFAPTSTSLSTTLTLDPNEPDILTLPIIPATTTSPYTAGGSSGAAARPK